MVTTDQFHLSDEVYFELQRCYGDKYVARREGQAIASAASYRELSEQLRRLAVVDRESIIIEFIEPPDAINVY